MTYQPQPYFHFDKQQKFSPSQQDFLYDNLSQASTTTNFLSIISSQECVKNQNQNRRSSTQSQILFKNNNLCNNYQQEMAKNNNTINLNININNNLTKNNISTFNLNGGIQNQQQQQQQNINQSQQNRRFSEYQSVSSSTNFNNMGNKNTNKSAQSLHLFHHNTEKKKANNNSNFNGNIFINKDFSVEEFIGGGENNNNNIHFNNVPSNTNIMEFQSSSEFDDENENNVEIDVKPKRKIFVNVEDKKKFVEDYRKKIKTELCKNFQLKGQCKFGDKCSFAHGYNELKEKTHLHTNYKTKPCKQYFYSGYCAYGYRCQYLHSEIKYLPEFKVFLSKLYQEKNLQLNLHTISSQRNYYQKFQWLSNMTNSQEAPISTTESDVKYGEYLLSLKLKRLQVFKKIKTDVESNFNVIDDDEFSQILKFSPEKKMHQNYSNKKNYNADESFEEENLMELDEQKKCSNFYEDTT